MRLQPLLRHPPNCEINAVLPEKWFAIKHQRRNAPVASSFQRLLVIRDFPIKRFSFVRSLCIKFGQIQPGTLRRFGQMIAKNVDQAHYLGQLIAESNDMELIAPIGLDIVCFRYNPGDLSLPELNALNKEIKIQLEETGKSAPGYTTLNDIYCIRVAIANHRSRMEDFAELIDDIRQIGVVQQQEIVKP